MKKVLLVAAAAALTAADAFAAEGMWTPDNLPMQQLRDKYKFAPNADWVGHAQRAALRLAGGCSGSFVSPSGLVLTNHHCVNSCVQQLSTAACTSNTTLSSASISFSCWSLTFCVALMR